MELKKYAFSLPEVLITLVVIGVVAVITIPTVIREFNERTNSYREANIAQKITQAMENMNASGDLNYYSTTEEFVQGLKKYLKVIKTCTSDNIDECWPTKTIITASGAKYEVKNAKRGTDLHTSQTTNTAGLVLADGTNIILTYNPTIGSLAGDNIVASKKVLPVGFGKTKEFAYTSSVTAAIDFVMDVNGTAGPNAETNDDGNYNDIRSFKIASFTYIVCPGYKFNGVCVYDMGKNYSPLACTSVFKDEKWCPDGQISDNNYYAGAKKACDDIGMVLATRSELETILRSEANPHAADHSGSYLAVNDCTLGPDHEYCSYVSKTANNYGPFFKQAYRIICVSK